MANRRARDNPGPRRNSCGYDPAVGALPDGGASPLGILRRDRPAASRRLNYEIVTAGIALRRRPSGLVRLSTLSRRHRRRSSPAPRSRGADVVVTLMQTVPRTHALTKAWPLYFGAVVPGDPC
jgi:hypothetical protein